MQQLRDRIVVRASCKFLKNTDPYNYARLLMSSIIGEKLPTINAVALNYIEIALSRYRDYFDNENNPELWVSIMDLAKQIDVDGRLSQAEKLEILIVTGNVNRMIIFLEDAVNSIPQENNYFA